MPKILVLHHSTYGHVEALASATTDGSRQVSANGLDRTRFQGRHVAGIAAKLAARVAA